MSTALIAATSAGCDDIAAPPSDRGAKLMTGSISPEDGMARCMSFPLRLLEGRADADVRASCSASVAPAPAVDSKQIRDD